MKNLESECIKTVSNQFKTNYLFFCSFPCSLNRPFYETECFGFSFQELLSHLIVFYEFGNNLQFNIVAVKPTRPESIQVIFRTKARAH